MTATVEQTREHIAYIGNLMFQRHLLDLAGGNISVRVGDVLCISPRYSGPLYHWSLKPQDVMLIKLDGTLIEGSGELSRESKVHLKLHNQFGDYGTAVIHCHARHVMVFASMNQPIPPIMEATRKFGTVPTAKFAPSHSADLSVNIAAAMEGQEERIRKHAGAVIAPYHGIFAMGRDLDWTADAVERIDTNAFCILMGRSLGASPLFEDERAVMEDTMANA
jgi:L-fuculose-phosphate aldolase